MITRHKQFTVLISALFIFLAQFTSLVHATDHPFHHEDAFCVAFQKAEKEKPLHENISLFLAQAVYISEVVDLVVEKSDLPFSSYYSSRAPPITVC